MLCSILLLTLAGQAAPVSDAADPAALEFFEKRVRPILVQRCFACHSPTSKQVEANLLLSSREAILRGGDSGPGAVAGDVEKSRLIEAVRFNSPDLQMPPSGKISKREIAVLEEWVRRGLPFTPTETVEHTRRAIDLVEGRKHWSFQPLVEQPLPRVDPRREGNRIDRFLQSALQKQGLSPSPPASPRVLIRRASFDLLGLPPAAEDVQQFEQAAARNPQAAMAALVERYLASPHYGQRWARHWLDLTRYCDVAESWREGDSQAWPYRDWVVGALNRDLPYHDFIRQQFAADLLPGAAPADNAALGFLGLSPTYWKELKLDHKVIQQVVAEEWEERIEAICGTFLGLTVACARCHDHKFDPITTQDYYALAGVLANVRIEDRPLIAEAPATASRNARAKVKQLQQQLDTLIKAKDQTEQTLHKQAELRDEIAQLKQTPYFETPFTAGISNARTVVLPDGQHRTKIEYRPGEMQDVAMHIRGNAAKPGPIVPRRFLAVLARDPQTHFTHGSGRRELAEAIVTEGGPLAARVIVNRVWAHHFGRGLVTTLSNFGTKGEPPSHPELLDDLAARFVAGGWSLKWLHREIMLSAAYQQSSHRDAARNAKDPDNVWLWRMKPRRLEIEAWRDAILTATGELDLCFGGPAVDLASAENHRRTLYGVVKRRELNDLLRLHDFPDPIAHSATRDVTTTPLQQLFTLNSPFLEQRSAALASRLKRESSGGTADRVGWLYATLFGREATPEELALAKSFLDARQPASEEAWRQYCHALLASNELLFVE